MGLSNSLDAESSLRVVRFGIETSGKPEILNSNQGSQFSCLEYISLLKREKIQVYIIFMQKMFRLFQLGTTETLIQQQLNT